MIISIRLTVPFSHYVNNAAGWFIHLPFIKAPACPSVRLFGISSIPVLVFILFISQLVFDNCNKHYTMATDSYL